MTERSLRLSLIASLVLNLFVGCALVAGVVEWRYALRDGSAAIAMPQAKRLRRAADALPEDQRHHLRQLLRANDPTALAEARAARADAARLLAASPYDPSALAAALDRARRADFALRTGMEGRLVTFAASLQPADRAVLAAALGSHRRRNRPNTDR